MDLTPKRVNCTASSASSSDGHGKHSIGAGVVFAIIAALVLIGVVVGALIGLYFVKKTKKPEALYNL